MTLPKSDGNAALTVPEFCQSYRVSRATFYRELAAGKLVIRKCGRRSLIPADVARAWFADLPEAAAPSPLKGTPSQPAVTNLRTSPSEAE